jgi:hypothetical protein
LDAFRPGRSAPADDGELIGTERRTDTKGRFSSEQPNGAGGGAVTDLGNRDSVIEIAIDIKNVQIRGVLAL